MAALTLISDDGEERVYELRDARRVRLEITDNGHRIKAWNVANNGYLGSIDLNSYEDGDGEIVYRITHAFLDKDPSFVRHGIGRQCILFWREVVGGPLTASEVGDPKWSDGSYLTGDGPGFISKLREERIL